MNRHEQLLEFAGCYADGVATEAQVRELEAALREDAAFRRKFLLYMNVDSALGTASRLAANVSASNTTLSSWAGLLATHRGWLTMAAALLVLALTAAIWNSASRQRMHDKSVDSSIASVSRASAPLAMLVASTDARWADPDIELAVRSGDMPTGMLRLETGVAEFKLARGATVVVLGPASVRFAETNEVFVQSGKVLCRCPTPGSRITLKTPATQIVDLGTEFAVEVASDQPSTQVAVVSGQVRVGTRQMCILKKGEAAVVGSDSVVRLTPLPAKILDQLMAAEASAVSGASKFGGNVLVDSAFTVFPDSAWWFTENHVAPVSGQQPIHAVAVRAGGDRRWPGLRQTVIAGDISGRLALASVEAMSPADDPLCERQSALLKLAFLDAQGHEFATAFRHFLHAGDSSEKWLATQVAAFAPPGTFRVQVQLLLSARGQSSGSVQFRNPTLQIATEPPGTASTQP